MPVWIDKLKLLLTIVTVSPTAPRNGVTTVYAIDGVIFNWCVCAVDDIYGGLVLF
jgi:hypothetical protein